VKKEMTDEKGLAPEVADKIGEYVKHKGERITSAGVSD
jgi:histidyl-tRNA synthetase